MAVDMLYRVRRLLKQARLTVETLRAAEVLELREKIDKLRNDVN